MIFFFLMQPTLKVFTDMIVRTEDFILCKHVRKRDVPQWGSHSIMHCFLIVYIE